MIQALNERQGAINEATSFRQIFRMDAAQAESVWKPIVDKVVATPALGQYLEDCIAHFDANHGKAAAGAEGGDQPYADPEARSRVAALEKQLQAERTQNVQRAIATEQAAITAKYPALSDPNLMQMVMQRAYHGAQNRPGYTLTTAADELASYLQRFAAPVTATAPVEVPALNGSGGTSPAGARRATPPPKRFSNPDEAVDDWINGGAAAAGFGT